MWSKLIFVYTTITFYCKFLSLLERNHSKVTFLVTPVFFFKPRISVFDKMRYHTKQLKNLILLIWDTHQFLLSKISRNLQNHFSQHPTSAMSDGVRIISRFWEAWAERDNGKEPTYPPKNGEAIIGRVCTLVSCREAGTWKKNAMQCSYHPGHVPCAPQSTPPLHIRT